MTTITEVTTKGIAEESSPNRREEVSERTSQKSERSSAMLSVTMKLTQKTIKLWPCDKGYLSTRERWIICSERPGTSSSMRVDQFSGLSMQAQIQQQPSVLHWLKRILKLINRCSACG